MTKINAYLYFNGDCEAAFNFYKSVFGGDFDYLGRYQDVPTEDQSIFDPEHEQKIMHISLPIGDGTILMGCDSPEYAGKGAIIGDNISLSIHTDDRAEADRLFNELSAGGLVKMPMNPTFWGAYFGMFTDKFEINWLINCELKE